MILLCTQTFSIAEGTAPHPGSQTVEEAAGCISGVCGNKHCGIRQESGAEEAGGRAGKKVKGGRADDFHPHLQSCRCCTPPTWARLDCSGPPDPTAPPCCYSEGWLLMVSQHLHTNSQGGVPWGGSRTELVRGVWAALCNRPEWEAGSLEAAGWRLLWF